MIIAYSYLRFSTPEQAQGDSERRQLEDARSYCQKNGLEFDNDLVLFDHGTSGFYGINWRFGMLAKFLEKIKEGKIKRGSFLLIESIDRLSRENLTTAFDIISAILNAGITIVTVSDNETKYSKDALNSSPYLIYQLIARIQQAHQESKQKSVRLRRAWGEKKKNNSVITKRVPDWLIVKDGKITAIPSRADIVNQIFDWTIAGKGRYVIAKKLNEELRVECWGRGKQKAAKWNMSYISKILKNRAVLGELTTYTTKIEFVDRNGKQKRRRLRIKESVRVNYYPAVITSAKWNKAHKLIASRKSIVTSGRKGSYQNIFTNLLCCGYCGSGMNFLNKGGAKRDWRYLCCGLGRFNILECNRIYWRYTDFENYFLKFLTDIDFSSLSSARSVSSLEHIELEIDDLEFKISEFKRKRNNIIEAIEKVGIDDELRNRRNAIIEEQTKLETALAEKNSLIDRAKQTTQQFKHSSPELKGLILKRDTPQLREKIHDALASVISKIMLCGGGHVSSDMFKRTLSKKSKLTFANYLNHVRNLKGDEHKRFFTVIFRNGEERTVTPNYDGKGFRVHSFGAKTTTDLIPDWVTDGNNPQMHK